MTDSRRLAEASAWRVRLTELGAERTPEFDAWLAAAPEHAEAWRQVEGMWQRLGEQATAPELIAARRDALARARSAGRERWQPTMRRRMFALGAAATLLITLAVTWTLQLPDVYRAERGERRVVTLEDGSRLSLDAASTVEVRYGPERRSLELTQGQARFDVAHDTARPFVVRARDRQIVAVGTAFTVDLLGPEVVVTLLEGRVVVLDDAPVGTRPLARTARPEGSAPRSIVLVPGERLSVPVAAAPRIEAVDLARAVAWEQGRLIVDDEPLVAVVERVSRHARSVEVVADPSVAELRISGVFNAGDVDTFVDSVTRYLDVRADRSDPRRIVLTRQP